MKLLKRLKNIFCGKANLAMDSYEAKNIEALVRDLEDQREETVLKMRNKIINVKTSYNAMEKKLAENKAKLKTLDKQAADALSKGNNEKAANIAYQYECMEIEVTNHETALANAKKIGESLCEKYSKMVGAYDNQITTLKMKASTLSVQEELNSMQSIAADGETNDLLTKLRDTKDIVSLKEDTVKATTETNEEFKVTSSVDDLLAEVNGIDKNEALERLKQRQGL